MHEHRSVPSVAEVFAENMRRERRRIDLNQERCGARARLHRTEISLLERAQRVPRIDTLLRIAGALEVEPAVLLRGIEWIPVLRDYDESGWALP